MTASPDHYATRARERSALERAARALCRPNDPDALCYPGIPLFSRDASAVLVPDYPPCPYWQTKVGLARELLKALEEPA